MLRNSFLCLLLLCGSASAILRTDDAWTAPMAAGALCHINGMVMVGTDGYARPAGALVGAYVVGVARMRVDNSAGGAGMKSVLFDEGLIVRTQDGSVTSSTPLGAKLYATSEAAVTKTQIGSLPAAGRFYGLDPIDGNVILHVSREIGAAAAGY